MRLCNTLRTVVLSQIVFQCGILLTVVLLYFVCHSITLRTVVLPQILCQWSTLCTVVLSHFVCHSNILRSVVVSQNVWHFRTFRTLVLSHYMCHCSTLCTVAYLKYFVSVVLSVRLFYAILCVTVVLSVLLC